MADRDHPPPTTLAAADRDQPTDEVEAIDLEVDDLAGADRGLEHQPDDGLVSTVMEGLPHRQVGIGHCAGPDQGAQLVVGERLHQGRLHAGCFDAGERISVNLAAGGEPGREPAHRELANAGGAGCGAGVEQPGDPGVERRPAHREMVAVGAPAQVVGGAVGVDRDGARSLVFWFYDVQADGYSLDDKRNPVEANDLPDVLERWASRTTTERDRARTEKSFCVPKTDIVTQGYDLSLNRYKEIVHDEIEHRPPLEITAGIEALEDEIAKGLAELRAMLS